MHRLTPRLQKNNNARTSASTLLHSRGKAMARAVKIFHTRLLSFGEVDRAPGLFRDTAPLPASLKRRVERKGLRENERRDTTAPGGRPETPERPLSARPTWSRFAGHVSSGPRVSTPLQKKYKKETINKGATWRQNRTRTATRFTLPKNTVGSLSDVAPTS